MYLDVFGSKPNFNKCPYCYIVNEFAVKTKSNYITSLKSRMIYRNSKYIPKQNKPTNWKFIDYITSLESKFKPNELLQLYIHRMT